MKKKIFDVFKNKTCDVIIGGPPCQAYSMAGLRDPNDPRGKLFEDYVKIVKKLQPKIFVMENVKGILSSKVNDEPIFDRIRNDLKAPYKVIPQLDTNKCYG